MVDRDELIVWLSASEEALTTEGATTEGAMSEGATSSWAWTGAAAGISKTYSTYASDALTGISALILIAMSSCGRAMLSLWSMKARGNGLFGID